MSVSCQSSTVFLADGFQNEICLINQIVCAQEHIVISGKNKQTSTSHLRSTKSFQNEICLINQIVCAQEHIVISGKTNKNHILEFSK